MAAYIPETPEVKLHSLTRSALTEFLHGPTAQCLLDARKSCGSKPKQRLFFLLRKKWNVMARIDMTYLFHRDGT